MSRQPGQFTVRACRLGDIASVGKLVRASFDHTYRDMVDPETLNMMRDAMSSPVYLGVRIVFRSTTNLVAISNNEAIGFALAQSDEIGDIILYMLYVDPGRKGHGAGSALLDAAIASFPQAKTIRLEVLRKNSAAISWYQAKGFEIFGETSHASGTIGVPAFYMDRKI